MRSPHPVWIRPRNEQLRTLSGGCDSFMPTGLDVVVSDAQNLSNPVLQLGMVCAKFAQGEVLEAPFPLLDAADTNEEARTLGLETAQITLDALCKTCEFRTKDL